MFSPNTSRNYLKKKTRAARHVVLWPPQGGREGKGEERVRKGIFFLSKIMKNPIGHVASYTPLGIRIGIGIRVMLWGFGGSGSDRQH